MAEPWPGNADTIWRVAHNGIMWHVARPDDTALCSRKISLYAKLKSHGGQPNYGDRMCQRCTEMLGRQQR